MIKRLLVKKKSEVKIRKKNHQKLTKKFIKNSPKKKIKKLRQKINQKESVKKLSTQVKSNHCQKRGRRIWLLIRRSACSAIGWRAYKFSLIMD